MNKSAFYKLSYGLYVITSRKEGKFNGQIANTVFQVTSDPPTLAVSINKSNYTFECITSCRQFVVSILAESAPMTMIGTFGFKCGRNFDKLDGIAVRTGITGLPIVTDHCTAFIEADVIDAFDCGTHTIFLGRILDADILDPSAEPMTYATYHKVKGGKAPKSAPTYQEPAPPQPPGPAAQAPRYVCTVCGYVYDPALGDPEGKVKPGTPFAELPADWVCPVCGAGKDKFAPEG
ncbi:MAG: rubredoxin [Syntrophales bacterium]